MARTVIVALSWEFPLPLPHLSLSLSQSLSCFYSAKMAGHKELKITLAVAAFLALVMVKQGKAVSVRCGVLALIGSGDDSCNASCLAQFRGNGELFAKVNLALYADFLIYSIGRCSAFNGECLCDDELDQENRQEFFNDDEDEDEEEEEEEEEEEGGGHGGRKHKRRRKFKFGRR
jgi:hypothetical protein